MNQQSLSQRFKEKVSSIFKSLCAGKNHSDHELQDCKQAIQRKSVPRRKRLTFVLEEVLMKLSRKNLVLDEFQACSSMLRLPPTVERHIAARLSAETVVVLRGNFTDAVSKCAPFALRVIAKQPSLSAPSNAVLARGKLPIRAHEGCIDALVCEVKNNICKAIEQALSPSPPIASNYVFICHEEVTPGHLREIFGLLQGRKMVQIERVMVLDKCITTIIYISSSNEFLHIDQQSLIQYLLAQSLRADPKINRFEFARMLDVLLRQGHYSEVVSALARVIQIERIGKVFEEEFLREVQERYPNTVEAVKKCDAGERERQGSVNDKMMEDTPLFGIRPRTSTLQFQHSEPEEHEPKRRRSSAIFQTLRGIGTSMEIHGE